MGHGAGVHFHDVQPQLEGCGAWREDVASPRPTEPPSCLHSRLRAGSSPPTRPRGHEAIPTTQTGQL